MTSLLEPIYKAKKEEKRLREAQGEREFKSSLIGKSKEEKQVAKTSYEREKTERKVSEGKREAVKKVIDKVSSFGENILRKPILGKPTVKVPSYSATKLIKQMSKGNIQVVRQGEIPETKEFNRSPFFSEEFRKADKETKSWLFKE